MWSKISLKARILLIFTAWLIFISFAHYRLNFDHGSKKIVYMGYMPVITNLAAPLLDYASKEREDIRFKALKFASFQKWANHCVMVKLMLLSLLLRFPSF